MKGSHKDITILRPVNFAMDSEYGPINYKKWCEKELVRIGNPIFFMRFTTDRKIKEKVCCITK